MRLFNKLFAKPDTNPGEYLGPVLAEKIANECVAKGIRYTSLHYVGVANADTTGTAITNYHKKTLGWSKDGYHLFLNDDGDVEFLEPIGTRVNGMRRSGAKWWKPWSRYNSNEQWVGAQTLQICFETTNGYKMSAEQEKCLIGFYKLLAAKIPTILIGGHREFPDFANYNYRQNTLCPGFSVSDWLLEKGIPKKNVFYEVWTPEGKA